MSCPQVLSDEAFPALGNFLDTWFCTAYDFAELPDVIARMKRLRAHENLRGVQTEVVRLEGVPLIVFNAFSARHGGRGFTPERYAAFCALLRP